MSTHTGPMAISPRFSMSSVPALPGVMVTFGVEGFISASAGSIFAFSAGVVRPLVELVAVAGHGVRPSP